MIYHLLFFMVFLGREVGATEPSFLMVSSVGLFYFWVKSKEIMSFLFCPCHLGIRIHGFFIGLHPFLAKKEEKNKPVLLSMPSLGLEKEDKGGFLLIKVIN